MVQKQQSINTLLKPQISATATLADPPIISGGNTDLHRFVTQDFSIDPPIFLGGSPDYIDNPPEFRPIPGEFGKEWGNGAPMHHRSKQRANRHSSHSGFIHNSANCSIPNNGGVGWVAGLGLTPASHSVLINTGARLAPITIGAAHSGLINTVMSRESLVSSNAEQRLSCRFFPCLPARVSVEGNPWLKKCVVFKKSNHKGGEK